MHEKTGRPIGDDVSIERLERLLDREPMLKNPGTKAIDKQGVLWIAYSEVRIYANYPR
jgi:hypothetical protein